MNSECVVLMGHYLDILVSESVSPVSRVFNNWKRPVASYILLNSIQEASVQFSSVAQSFLTLQLHESQQARPPCPSPTPGVHSNSRPSSQWCHPAISSSVVPFSSCPQSLPASESFPMSQLFTWGGQSIGVSALASFLPKKKMLATLNNIFSFWY